MKIRRPVPPLRRTPSHGPDYGLLPRRAWLIILDYLDAESRLNVTNLGPNFERLVRGERCMRTVICGANHESASLRSLLEGGRCKHVRVLYLTNCIVATPDSLLACVALCTRLTDLRCVGCPFDADLLLKVVTKWLPSLQRLEWSLRIRNLWRAIRIGETADGCEIARLPPANALERVYVEVVRAAPASHRFLALFVSLCPNLRRLHVHELPGEHRVAFQLTRRLATSVAVFTYSRDEVLAGEDFLGEHESSAANRPFLQYAVRGNVTYVGGSLPLQPANSVFLGDLVQRRCVLELERLGNLVLVVLVTAEAPGMLLQAAAEQSWNGLRALTLVSASEPDDISAGLSGGDLHGRPYGNRRVSPCLAHALGIFLAACRTLTELNLSAFHFSQEHMIFTDFTAASGLGRLRALSVAPCALMTPGDPLRNFAVFCTRLEELDVRSSRVDAALAPPCIHCSSGFLQLNDVSEPAFNNWRSSLQRLTLYNVRQLDPLHFFVREFHVVELRLCGVDALRTRSGSHELLGGILGHTPHLRSLVVEHDVLPLHADFLWSILGAARQLRYLCLLSKVASRRVVIMRFAGRLLRLLPSLVSLHVHYAEADSPFFVVDRRTTLVRRARSWFENNVEDREVVVLEEDQCALCCTSTFVGLAKPRNRDWCRL